jgi:hypothetical protein
VGSVPTDVGRGNGSDESAVRPDYLTVDPVPGWAGQECDDVGEVRGLTEPLQRNGERERRALCPCWR